MLGPCVREQHARAQMVMREAWRARQRTKLDQRGG